MSLSEPLPVGHPGPTGPSGEGRRRPAPFEPGPEATVEQVLAVAHRGASARAPENTLAAVRLAADLGADAVEVDLQRTRDGALVLLHDAGLGRTTDAATRLRGRGPWSVGSLRLEEVRRLDAGSWKAPEFAGETVPTLAETLDVVGARPGLRLLVELKLPERHPGIVADLASELTRAHAGGVVDLSHVVVQSFDVAAVKELKARCPRLTVGVLGLPPREHLPALGTWAGQVNPHHAALDAGYVEAVHAHGMRCLTWTVDHRFAMRRVLRAGVDGVITNRPDVFLRQR
jgi:glycerophosphoryl diester phosphodiesterase